MSATHNFTHDILILGGGLVGNALACALEGHGLRVGLVEAQAPPTTQSALDQRKIALARASLIALEQLGVLQGLESPPEPIKHIHVSAVGSFGALRLAASGFDLSHFGAVVLAGDLNRALLAKVSALQNLDHRMPAQVLAVRNLASGPVVDVLQDGKTESLVPKLLLAADGSASITRDAMGISATTHDYQQRAFVCTLRSSQSPDGRAFERFSAQGPVALLPMPDGLFGAICGVSAADADAVAAMSDEAYVDYLQQRFGWRAGRIRECGKRSVYPLLSVVADRLTANRTVLLGNAAQSIHPIGAQGFNLGLRDALSAADVIAAIGPDGLGSHYMLEEYVRRRSQDRAQTLAFSGPQPIQAQQKL